MKATIPVRLCRKPQEGAAKHVLHIKVDCEENECGKCVYQSSDGAMHPRCFFPPFRAVEDGVSEQPPRLACDKSYCHPMRLSGCLAAEDKEERDGRAQSVRLSPGIQAAHTLADQCRAKDAEIAALKAVAECDDAIMRESALKILGLKADAARLEHLAEAWREMTGAQDDWWICSSCGEEKQGRIRNRWNKARAALIALGVPEGELP